MTVSTVLNAASSDGEGTGVQITAGGRVNVKISGTFDSATRVVLLGSDADSAYVPLDLGQYPVRGNRMLAVDVGPNVYLNAELVDAGTSTAVTVKFVY